MRRPRLAVMFAWLGVVVCVTTGALAAAQPSAARAAADTVLTVKGPTGATKAYTLAQLRSGFTAYTGYAGYVKTGKIGMEAPHPVKGVRLVDLLAKVGYKSGSVMLDASDGYQMKCSSKWVLGRKVTMYKASPPKYPVAALPRTNPLTAIVAYQEKKAGARINDSSPWKSYTSTYDSAGSAGIGPLRFWWAYRKWVRPGYVQIGWSSMRMVKAVTVVQ